MTVHENVSVAPIVVPPSSLTVTDIAYGLAAAAPDAIVPEICPVAVSIDRPPGNPVAAYVSASPSRSLACADRETVSPSAPARSCRSWSKVGGRFTLVTVIDNVAGAPVVVPPASLTVTDTPPPQPAVDPN